MFTIMKRLGLSSGLIAAMLAVCSCTPNNAWPRFRGGKFEPKSKMDIGRGPWDVPVVGLPLTAVYLGGVSAIQERKREAKPREDGPFIDYWSKNGKKAAEGTYKNRKLDGVYTVYFESGEKKGTATYVGGERNGPYTWWFESGQKSVEGTFKAGKQHGTTTTWHKNGRKESEVTWSSGKLNGPHTRWHENGQKSFEGVVRNGEYHGSTKGYYENGQMHFLAERYYRPQANARLPSGMVSHWGALGGNPDGTNISWHKNGQKKRVSTYKKGKLISRTIWHENGQKAVEKNFKDGEPASELVSAKYWNSKGKEVETEEGAYDYPARPR